MRAIYTKDWNPVIILDVIIEMIFCEINGRYESVLIFCSLVVYFTLVVLIFDSLPANTLDLYLPISPA